MRVEKFSNATISFKEGLELKFTSTKPHHLRFFFSSTNTDTEDTNLRLKNSIVQLLFVSIR